MKRGERGTLNQRLRETLRETEKFGEPDRMRKRERERERERERQLKIQTQEY